MSAKVLIIEDEDAGFNAAIAGLIPSGQDREENLLGRRINFALQTFEIKRAHNLSEGIELISSFKPDLCIIDVNLPNLSPELRMRNIFDGIDLYHNFPDNNCVKFLFSLNGHKAKFITKLKPGERTDFINKTDGAGYESLSTYIGEYLTKVCANLIKNADPLGIEQIIASLKKKTAIKELMETPIAVGSRLLRLKDLLTFNNRIESDQYGTRMVNTTTATEATVFLKMHKAGPSERKNRKIFNKPAVRAFVSDYEDRLADANEPAICKQADQMIRQIMERLEQDPNYPVYKLLNTIMPFRVVGYFEKDNFLEDEILKDLFPQFINGLIVRRVLVFFEVFYHTHIDSGKHRLKIGFEDFYDEFTTNIIQAVRCIKNHPSRSTVSQHCDNLNLGHEEFKAGKIERISAMEYYQYRGERKWETSPEYVKLVDRAIDCMTRK